MNKIAYCIDLHKSLEILELSGQALAQDLLYYNTKDVRKLTNYDRRVFKTLTEAEAFLKDYTSAMNGLSKNEAVYSKQNRPKLKASLLAKRHYIVLATLGLKKQTVRSYKKNLKKGDEFFLYDQKHFLKVKLTSLVDNGDGSYTYNYKV